ncbi:DUF4157 domain-containing protein [Moorena sp. SIO3H5]|uniref:eCIS core domain-containing protein n=1 Tax=Moorena sp. SIO3H5 TaxID=2607834 RepID=UPI0013BA0E48|nr:DUF4157 domain-containing protein [Moorena sp. SIO3H5]NEO74315.1 DUF4157 domain-containing protein [Moorena sp. SIO3H5]
MTRQYVRESNQSPQKDTDNWILQRSAVRELPAKTLTPQTETAAGDRSGIQLDLMEIPVSNHTAMPVQAKLKIGPAGDKYEQEADRVAKQVVQQLHGSQSGKLQPRQTLQRLRNREVDEELQRKPRLQLKGDREGMTATPELESSIARSRGSGQPLSEGIREPMEKAFGGVDFSGVRVHTDGQSDKLNRAIQAKAFTTEKDIFFRRGEYVPSSRGGQETIAHELTHVVQQNSGQSAQDKPKEQRVETKTELNRSVIQRIKSDKLDEITKQIPEFKSEKMDEFWDNLEILTQGKAKENDIFYLLPEDTKNDITDRNTLIEALEVLVDEDEYDENTTKNFVMLINKALIEAGIVAGATSAESVRGATDENEKQALLYIALNPEEYLNATEKSDKLKQEAKKWLDQVGEKLKAIADLKAGDDMAEAAPKLASIIEGVEILIINALEKKDWAIYTVNQLSKQEFFERFAINAKKSKDPNYYLCHHSDWSIPLIAAINHTKITKIPVKKNTGDAVPLEKEELAQLTKVTKEMMKGMNKVMKKYGMG